MNKLIFSLLPRSSLRIFCFTFAWVLLMGAFIQLVVLPAIPSIYAGNGLMAGGDSVWFHSEAVELAALMSHQGWQVWDLRPQGNAPIGMAAAVYFLTGLSEPWVLLPINAAVFALAAVSLHGIFLSLSSERSAFMATLPFLLFPSAALIYSQIHKDVFSIAGILMIVLVWVRFLQAKDLDGFKLLSRIALTALGCTLVWVVRPYLLQPLTLASVLAMLILITLSGRRRRLAWWGGILFCLFVQVGYSNISLVPITNEFKSQQSPEVVSGNTFIEKKLASVNSMRAGFAMSAPNAGSNIDVHVRYESIFDLLLYVPRALQVGLLAPFPSMWIGDGVSPGAGLMRFLAGVEMTVSYVLLAGVFGLWLNLKNNRAELMVSIVMATALILVMALVVCNVGTLYRMRYGGWQILNGLGVLGWVLWLQASRLARRSP